MMSKINTIFLIVIFGLLCGCKSTTTLILLPDDNGNVGAITVKSNADERVIDKAYDSVSTNASNNGLTEINALDKAQVNRDYAELIEAQPKRVKSFLLYFSSGSTTLVPESMKMIPQILVAIKDNAPTEISIIGHADTQGSDLLNNKLSMQRALAVERLLKEQMPTLNNVTVQSFGSKDLLIPTPPNVDELRNRRVEILIL